MPSFSSLLSGLEKTESGYRATVFEDWLQGRTLYGGLSTALSYEAVRQSLDGTNPPLRSAQIAFIGPASGDLAIKVTPLRQGRSVHFLSVDLVGEKGLATRATFCFGAARGSSLTLDPPAMPDVPDPETLLDIPPLPGAPNFIKHFDMRLAIPPGKEKASVLFWVRHRDIKAHQSVEGLLALADSLPPAIIIAKGKMVPVSTMTWQVNMLQQRIETRDGWWLVQSTAEAIEAGYSSQPMMVWSRDGTAMISATQSIAVFD
ncbi:acyl-CoA thioesterase [Iodidimonas muriae]|uniref:Acyl-CoA thioesterase n=1 Tax=Iodidimonas muriae TaxID=261467 RepID=A0ABQ2LDH5_9PROT|nr:thioesterase family protein [Iodidimonas muriae]GER07889.1 acyl-CoA thioesterase [Kordiimonadales bacterium JCM 17843]GGO12000.1 acyl-CoA thioesterase [Iodidimonas muriae]